MSDIDDALELMKDDERQASRAVYGAADEKPDEAARAQQLSEQTGFPAPIIHRNLESFERDYKTNLNQKIVDMNPALRDWINAEPMAAKIAKDDFHNLDEATELVQKLNPGRVGGILPRPKEFVPFSAPPPPENRQPPRVGLDELGDVAKGFAEGYGTFRAPWEIADWLKPEDVEKFPQLARLTSWAGYGPEMFFRSFTGVAPAVGALIKNELMNFGLSESDANYYRDQTAGFVEAKLMDMAGHGAKVELGRTAKEIATAKAEERLSGTKLLPTGDPVKPVDILPVLENIAEGINAGAPFMRDGHLPPSMIHEFWDDVHKTVAQQSAQALDEALRGSTKAQTRELSPDLYSRLLHRVAGDEKFEVPAEVVRKLYGDKVPEAEDGILGWVPRLREQLEAAEAYGGSIEIPYKDYLAKVEPDIAKVLREEIRGMPEGLSISEGKVLDEIRERDRKEREEKFEPPNDPPPKDAVEAVRRQAGMDKSLFDRPLLMAEPDDRGQIEPTIWPKLIREGDELGGEVPHPQLEGKAVPRIYGTTLGELFGRVDFSLADKTDQMLNEFYGNVIKEQAGYIPVHIVAEGDVKKLLSEHPAVKKGGEPPGYFSPKHNHIVLVDYAVNGSMPGWYSTKLILHEGDHALRSLALHNNPHISDTITVLMKDADAFLSAKDPKARKAFDYAFTDPHEFMAEMTSRPALRKWLAQAPASPDTVKSVQLLADKMGIKDKIVSTWDAVRVIFKDLYNSILGKIPTDSVLDQVFKLNEILEEANQRLERMAIETGVPKGELLAEPVGAKAAPGERPTFGKMALDLPKKWNEKFLKLMDKKTAEDMEFQFQQAQKQERVRQTKEWKENFSRMTQQVIGDFKGRPDIALGNLFLGEGKDKPRLDTTKLTAKQKEMLPKALYGRGGIDPEQIATSFGLTNGDNVIQILAALNKARGENTFRKFVRDLTWKETSKRMLGEHGDIEENIMNEAIEHVLRPTEMDRIHEEFHALGMLSGKEPTFTKEDTQAMARTDFANSLVGEVTVNKKLRDMGKASRDTVTNLLDGKPDESYKSWQQHYLSARLAVEAVKFQKELKQFGRLLDRYRKRPTPDKPGGRIPMYTNFIHEIMFKIGEDPLRTQEDLQREIARGDFKSLQQLVETKNRDEKLFPADDDNPKQSFTMPVAPFLFEPGPFKSIEAMTVEEFRAVHAAIKTLDHHSKSDKFNEIRGQKREHGLVIDTMVSQMARAGRGEDVSRAAGDTGKSLARMIGTSVLQVETILNRIDLDNPWGIMNQAIFRPAIEGANYKSRLEKEYGKEIREIFKDVTPRMFLRKMGVSPLIDPRYGTKIEVNRGQVLAVLQNVGNELQMEKLAKGYQTTPQEIVDWLHTVTNKADWDRAQKLGDLFEKAFGLSENTYADLYGVAPARIELKSLQTPHGAYRGWYHPLIYDTELRSAYENISKQKPTPLDIMDQSGYYKPSTATGYTKTRTGYVAPILLNFDAVPYKMGEILNDIAMRPAVVQISRIISDSRFDAAFRKYWGKEYFSMLEPWLRDAAGQKRYKTAGEAYASTALNFFRENLTSSLIGLNPGTFLKHTPTAWGMSMKEVGGGDFLREFFHLFAFDSELGDRNLRFAYDNSEELQRRMSLHWQEVISGSDKGALSKLEEYGKHPWMNPLFKVRDAIQAMGAFPVAMGDMASAVPTWLAAYKRALTEGHSHGDAVYAGDRSVRRAHGSTAIVARPEVMRGGVGKALLVPFYNFFNTALQRQYEQAWKAKLALRGIESVSEDGSIVMRPGVEYDDGGLPELEDARKKVGVDLHREYKGGLKGLAGVGAGIIAYVLWPALVEQAVTPIDVEKDDWGTAAAKIVGRDLASSWPIARDVANYVLEGREPSLGLYSTMVKNLTEPLHSHPNSASRAIRNWNTMLGAMTGLTNEEMGRLAQFAYEYSQGENMPDSYVDVWRGIRYGTVKQSPRRHPDFIERAFGE